MPLFQEFPVWLDKFFAFAFKSFFNNKNVIQLNCKIYRKLLKGLKMVKLVLLHKRKPTKVIARVMFMIFFLDYIMLPQLYCLPYQLLNAKINVMCVVQKGYNI